MQKEIINDITALRGDGKMARVATSGRRAGDPHAHEGTPSTMQKEDLAYGSLIGEIRDFLEDRIEKASSSGIRTENLVIDPGIGFGKNVDDNLRLLRHLGSSRPWAG